MQRKLGAMIAKPSNECVECPGVTPGLENLNEQGFPMAVVSTSAKPRVVTSMNTVIFSRFFDPEHVHFTTTSLDPPSSKPDSASYLYVCKELGFKPGKTISVEDSSSGATAATRVENPPIGYVGIDRIDGEKEKIEQIVGTLTEETKAKGVVYYWKEFQDCLNNVEVKRWAVTRLATGFGPGAIASEQGDI
ncbi:hypothetical protein MMC21_008471 [Puttea exsequens]|nr:hypothetical protein [Puttea exsequens]